MGSMGGQGSRQKGEGVKFYQTGESWIGGRISLGFAGVVRWGDVSKTRGVSRVLAW